MLPGGLAAEMLENARAIASTERFFHWTLEFPEVFYAPDGAPLASPGFDAVVGNPPWEMLRGDRGDASTRDLTRSASSRLTTFARGSGVYALQSCGQANLYQLFLERGLSLVRAGGRIGLVLPSGFGSDHGCAALRRRVLDTTCVDTFTSVENRDGLFPIHRGLKFLLVTASRGGVTTSVPCRYGVRSPEVLEALPDEGPDGLAVPVPRLLLSAVSGEEQLAIPELRTSRDLDIVSSIVSRVPPLGGAGGLEPAVRARAQRLGRQDAFRHVERAARRRPAGHRGQADPAVHDRPVAGPVSHREARRAETPARASVRAAETCLSRCCRGHQPSHAHRGRHSRRGGHHAHAVLPERRGR